MRKTLLTGGDMAETGKDFESCFVTVKGNIGIVTLNRPEKMNALNPELFDGISASFAYLDKIDEVRSVILTGAGEHFSAGGDVEKDINPLRSKTVNEFRAYFESLAALYGMIFNYGKPTIAAVNGYALGAGMELTLMCDIRIAADNSRMGEFFVRMGLVPETGMCMLPKIVGLGMAKLICMTGDLVSADEALRIGLVERVVPASDLIPEAEKLALKLANNPASVRIIKRAINEFATLPFEATETATIGCQFEAVKTADHAEAVAAFMEKRKPLFRGE